MSIKIQPVHHKTLTERAAGKLAASILDGSVPPGSQLPPERELMSQLMISRSTLREALKTLEDNQLIESRRGSAGSSVSWMRRV
jgi:DNA-binding FadR family transcriptional regulator